jgi:hypothetical protein
MPSSSLERSGWRGLHPPRRLLELVAFEPTAAIGEVLAHAEGCQHCRDVVATLQEERRRFLAERPARPFVARVVERVEAQARPRLPWLTRARLVLATGLAAAAAAVLLVPGGPGPVLFKGGGGASLSLYASRGGGPARPHDPRQPLHPGDLLRFGVSGPRGGYVAIFGVDADGRTTRYFPGVAGADDRLSGREAVQLLSGSTALDGSLGREWIVLLVARERLAADQVAASLRQAWLARRGQALSPAGLDAAVQVLAIEKVQP